MSVFLRDARLIGLTQCPIKVDFISELPVMDPDTGGVSKVVKEVFSKGTEVEIKCTRSLGGPKKHVTYAPAVIKLSSRDEVEQR